ncbi:MAG TPA: hypothetical protein VIC85_00850 [Ktedonobacterales bacterium]
MPTHDAMPLILREWAKLTPQRKKLFLAAVDEMVDDLRAHGPLRPSPRVKRVSGHPGVMEMTWAPDGRATFHFGQEEHPGDQHITWRRIVGHEILRNP